MSLCPWAQRRGLAWGGADAGRGWLGCGTAGPGLRAVPGPLTPDCLPSCCRKKGVKRWCSFAQNTWHLVETDRGWEVLLSSFHLVFSVLFEIG